MEGLQLGSAAFNFVLGTEGFARGAAKLVSTAAGAAGAVSPQAGKIGDSFAKVDEKLGGVMRSTERFSRGLRGITPDIAHAKEMVYQYEDSQAKLARSIERQKMLIEEKQAAEQRNLDTIARLTEKEEKHRRSVLELNAAMENENAILKTMQSATAQDAAAIEKQQNKYDKTIALHERLATYKERLSRQIDVMTQKQQANTAQIELANIALAKEQQKVATMEAQHGVLSGTIARLTTEYQLFATRINDTEAEMNQEVAALRRTQAAIVDTQNAIKDLNTEKKRYDELETAAVHNIDMAVLKQGELKQKLGETEKTYKELVALNAKAPLGDPKVIEEAAHEVDKALLKYQQASDAVKKFKRAYGDLQTENDRLGASMETLQSKLASLQADEGRHNASLSRQSAYVEELKTRYGTLPAAIARAEEELKALEISQNASQHQIVIAKNNIELLKKAHLEESAALNDKAKNIERVTTRIAEMDIRMTEEYHKLQEIKNQRGASNSEIRAQENRILELQKAIQSETEAEQRSSRAKTEATQRQARLNHETESSKLTLKDLVTSQEKLNTSLEFAKQRLQEKIDKTKQKMQADKESAEATKKVEKAAKAEAEAISKAGSVNSEFAESSRRATSIQEGFNGAMMKTSTVLRDITVGAVGSFIGNTLSSLVTGVQSGGAAALDAYKDYETLGMSLKALSARELVASGAFEDIKDAQAAAGEQSERLVGWMEKLAIQSPFGKDDISGAFRLGNALGFTSSQTQRLIADTVDWASATGGTGQSIESVIRAMGQMHNTGKVTLEDLNQMTDAGLGARDILRNEFQVEIEKSGKSLEDLISAGVLPADRAINAMAVSMEKDFGGAAGKAGDSMTGLLNSLSDLKSSGLRELFSSTFKAIKEPLEKLVVFLQSGETIDAIQRFGQLIGNTVGVAINWLATTVVPAAIQAFQTWGPVILDAFGAIAAIAQSAYEWGYNIGAMFQQGLADTIDMIVSTINWIGGIIGEWMEPHSPPKFLPHIDIWGKRTFETWIGGAKTVNVEAHVLEFGNRVSKTLNPQNLSLKEIGKDSINAYLAGWTDADFSLMNSLSDQISDTLQSLVDVGAMDESALLPALIGTDDEIKRAIDGIIETGTVSQDVFNRIKQAAGPAGEQIAAYVTAVLQSEAANRQLKAAQEELTAITKKYDAQLAPLQARLEAMNKTEEVEDRQKKVRRLEQMAERYKALGMEKQLAAVQKEIARLSIEAQIASIEQEKQSAESAAQAKVNAAQAAAEAAAKEMAMQQQQIELQKKQNELIQKQIDLMNGKVSSDSSAEEDAAAKERYEFNKASTKDQIKMLEEKQKKERQGSAAWYALQEQIDAKKRELDKKDDKALSDQEKEEKKRLAEEEKRFKSELAMRLAAASSEEERLKILQDAQGRYNVGTKEYMDMQRQIEVQQKKAESESEKQVKAVQKLSDAEFEAQLATQDRAGKIEMLRNRMEGLTKGTMEYEKTLKRLNSLEFAEDHQKGGKGKTKGTPIGGSPLKGLDAVGTSMDKVGNSVNKVTLAVDRARQGFTSFQEKIAPLFKFLKENSGILAFVIQKLAMSFVIGLAIEKAAKPLLRFILGLRQFITWANIAWVALTFLGYAWKTNLGGIRDIVFDVWNAIQKPFQDIKDIIKEVSDAFAKDGLSGAIDKLMEKLPQLGGDIANIGVTIFEGVLKWVDPLVENIGKVGDGVIEWVKNGGLEKVWETLRKAASNLFSTTSGDGFLSSATIAAGILGLVGGVQMVLQSALGGVVLYLQDEGPGFIQDIGNWLQKEIPTLFEYVMGGLGILVSAALEGLIPAMTWIGKRIIDVAVWLLPMLPDLLSGLVTGLSIIVSWLIGRGVPLLFKGVIDLMTYIYKKIGEMLPELGFNIGRFLGSTLTKLAGALLTGLVALSAQIWLSFQDGSFLSGAKAFGESILTFFMGLIKGIAGIVLGFLVGLWEPIANIAKDLVSGLGEGLLGDWYIFLNAIGQAFDDAVAWIKDFLGIASPSKLFAGFATFMIDGLLLGFEKISEFIASITKYFTDIKELIILYINMAISWVVNHVETFVDDTVSTFSQFKDDVIKLWEDLKTLVIDTVTEWVTSLSDTIKSYFSLDDPNSIPGMIVSAWDKITESITNFGATLAESFTTMMESAKRSLVDGLNDLIDMANRAIDALNEVSDKVGLGHIPHIPRIEYALGTQYAEGGLALVGENGPEVVEVPRGAKVTPAGKTLAMFQDAAKDMIDRTMSVVQAATGAVEKASVQAAQALMNAAQQDKDMRGVAQQITVNNNTTNTSERHDHWNLTVNTKATTPSVVQDYATMRAVAGV